MVFMDSPVIISLYLLCFNSFFSFLSFFLRYWGKLICYLKYNTGVISRFLSQFSKSELVWPCLVINVVNWLDSVWGKVFFFFSFFFSIFFISGFLFYRCLERVFQERRNEKKKKEIAQALQQASYQRKDMNVKNELMKLLA